MLPLFSPRYQHHFTTSRWLTAPFHKVKILGEGGSNLGSRVCFAHVRYIAGRSLRLLQQCVLLISFFTRAAYDGLQFCIALLVKTRLTPTSTPHSLPTSIMSQSILRSGMTSPTVARAIIMSRNNIKPDKSILRLPTAMPLSFGVVCPPNRCN